MATYAKKAYRRMEMDFSAVQERGSHQGSRAYGMLMTAKIIGLEQVSMEVYSSADLQYIRVGL